MPGTLEPLDVMSIQIPYHFRCPISLELMSDPVTVSTGQTYDRSSIDSWVATGNTTCPVTRAPLTDFSLIPNHTLRRLIQDWCVANRSLGVVRIPTPKQPAEPVTIRGLLSKAGSVTGSAGSRLAALRRLRGLARDSERNRHVISMQDAARSVLLEIVFSGENGAELRTESLAILSCLALSEAECEGVASDPGRVGFLVSLLYCDSVEVRVDSAALLETVLAGTRCPGLRAVVSSADGIYEGIVGILNCEATHVHAHAHAHAMKVGVKALFALCLCKQHRHRAAAAGAAEKLIEKLPEFEKNEVERALATVELLCRVPSGCAALAAHRTTVQILVKTMMRVSDRATEYATGALLALCSASEECLREAAAAGVVTQLLVLVQSERTERAKRKAQMLLKLMRNSWPGDSMMGSSDEFGCSDVVQF